MKRLLTALAVGATLTAGSAFAQDTSMDTMLSMIETQAARALQEHGYADVDVQDLSFSQVPRSCSPTATAATTPST